MFINKLPKLIIILGPTASGKTALTEKLAFEFGGEIVSADSRQVYRGMDIGTNKSQKSNIKNQKYKSKIKNHLIDIVNPDENFTLSQYKKLASTTIKNITKRGKLPFLVGGTGLYIQAIVDNLIIPEVPPDAKIRKKLELQTNEQLFSQLKKLDPTCAKKIDAKNRRRLIRALEVCIITGQPFSRLRQKDKPLFNALQIGIRVPKKELDQRIDQRVDAMVRQGLIDEVKRLKKEYLDCHSHEGGNPQQNASNFVLDPRLRGDDNRDKAKLGSPAFSGIGYQEIIQYLADKIPLDKAIELIKQHTKQYAKRQMTWFKRDPRIHWITKYSEAEKLIKDFLGK